MWSDWSGLEKLIWLYVLKGASKIIRTITGAAPLNLEKAVKAAIVKLTQYGKVTTSGGDIYCNNGKLVAVHRSGLPSGYKLLEYIGGSGSQYVITDLYLASTDVVECEFRNSTTTGYGAVYGVFRLGESSALYGNQTYYGYNAANDKVDTDIRVNTEWHTSRHDFVNGTLTIDDTTVTFTPFEFVNSTKNAVLSRYYNNNYGYNWKGYVRKFKVTRNGEVICDLLPAKDSSDVAGLYDLVSGSFYTAAAGTLLEGNEVDDYELSVVGTPEVLTIGEDTASGAIASFETTKAAPVRSLLASITPIQDLHGYDNPWSAGGGANLLDLDKASYNSLAYGLTVARDGDGVRITGTATQSGYLAFNLIVDYSGETLGGKGYVLQVFDVTSGYSVGSVWGFRTESERAFAISLTNVTAGQAVNCFMRLSVAATSQTAWTPYSNICPISGHTDADVTRTGKNLLNLVESEMISSGWDRAFPISVKEGTYIISCQNDFGASTTLGSKVSFADESNTIIKVLTYSYNFGWGNYHVGVAATVTAEEASKIKRIIFALRAGGASYSDIAQGNLQLELGSTTTTYEPYAGQTYPITFPTSAGTVYGGTLDVTTGKLTVDRAMADMGTLTWSGWEQGGSFIFYSHVSDKMPVRDVPCKSSQYAYNSAIRASWDELLNGELTGQIGGDNVYVRDNRYSSIADFKTAMSGVQLVYPLATPIVYDLTPTEVTTLLGMNNVWSDTGDVVVTYAPNGVVQTASVVNLFADGDVKDEQDIISGTVTRRTEVSVSGGEITISALAEPITERVTAQLLRTAEGNNTVSVTSEVDPVNLECKYAASEA